MNAYARLYIRKEISEYNDEPIYICNYQIKKNDISNPPIISNFFAIDPKEYDLFINLFCRLRENTPRLINLKINKFYYDKCVANFKFSIVNEYLTPREKELDIRRIIIGMPHYKEKKQIKSNKLWEILYTATIEMSENLINTVLENNEEIKHF